MSCRRLMNQLLVCLPVSLMVLMGVSARTYDDGYEFPKFSEAQNRLVEQYVEPLRSVANLPRKMPRLENTDEIFGVAHDWVDRFREGLLEPIPAAGVEGELPRGAREQVLVARTRLVNSLKALGLVLEESGQSLKATEAFLLAYEVLEITKESDSRTITVSSRGQWSALTHLCRCVSKVSSDDRFLIWVELRRLSDMTRSTNDFLRTTVNQVQNQPTFEGFQEAGMLLVSEVSGHGELVNLRNSHLSEESRMFLGDRPRHYDLVVAARAQFEQSEAVRLIAGAMKDGRPLPELLPSPSAGPRLVASADQASSEGR